ncbi:MAG TPA: outer membrane beta-barrel protein [Flavobacterium sp.]|uniref:outer membrane beta-barrel protein n=1 Tax=unclassified Flavobacterium TaxID=196869 RepID=UPI0025BA4767|nr:MULTISPECIES: outer membrane beta-barrel protein [unclassified Flavobacterium]HRE78542.1 outer membrane beta-barrel protein [Flavobacterium sp.]
MKKCLAIFVFIFSGTLVSNAQFEFKPGLRGGVNIAKVTNFEVDSKTDFFVGGQFELKFVDFYSLQPEVIYSRQGFKADNDNYSIDYLSLGITNKFTFGGGFNVLVGPTIDFKVGDNLPTFFSDELIGVDFALMGGIGYTFENGLAVDVRFKQGLVDIFGDNYNEYNDENGNGNFDEVKLNQLFQFGVSYSFDLK